MTVLSRVRNEVVLVLVVLAHNLILVHELTVALLQTTILIEACMHRLKTRVVTRALHYILHLLHLLVRLGELKLDLLLHFVALGHPLVYFFRLQIVVVVIHIDPVDINSCIDSVEVSCYVALSVLWHGGLRLLTPVHTFDLIQDKDVLAAPEVSLRRLSLMEDLPLDLLNAVLLDLLRSQISKAFHVSYRLFTPVGDGKVHCNRAGHHLLPALEDEALQADFVVASTERELVLAILRVVGGVEDLGDSLGVHDG